MAKSAPPPPRPTYLESILPRCDKGGDRLNKENNLVLILAGNSECARMTWNRLFDLCKAFV